MANGLITLKDLQDKFAASGVYTIYRDETLSQVFGNNQQLRLVVGFSKTGPKNIAVYIAQGDTTTATRLFGKRDKSLERRGSFFHKSIEVALDEGPVLALNMLKLNNEVDENWLPTENADVVDYKSFSVDIVAQNGINRDKLYASFYNKERFWFPDREYLLATRATGDAGKIFNLVNLSQAPKTFIVRKSTIQGYEISVAEWYGNTEIPSYLKPHDLISDYFIDVIIINGDFGPAKYLQLATDPVFGQFFDNQGLMADKLVDFLARPEITSTIYTGCIIPNFKDKDDIIQYIEKKINDEVRTSGILCAIDKKELDRFETETNTNYIDLVGHRLLSSTVTDLDFLSYKRKITQDFTYTKKTSNAINTLLDNDSVSIAYSNGKITVTILAAHPDFVTIPTLIGLKTLFNGVTTAKGIEYGITVANPSLEVSRFSVTDAQIVFDVISPLKENEKNVLIQADAFVDFDFTPDTAETLATSDLQITGAGSTGDTITVSVDEDGTEIVIGSYITLLGDTPDLIAAGVEAAIDAGTGTHGYTASTLTDTVTVTAPTGTGAIANDYALVIDIIGTITYVADPAFTGGINATSDMTLETTRDRFYLDGTDTYFIADTNNQIYLDWKSGSITNGDKIQSSTVTQFVKIDEIYADSGVDIVDDYRKIIKISLFTDADLTIPIVVGAAIAFGSSLDAQGLAVSDITKLNIISLVGSINQRFDAEIIGEDVAKIAIVNEPDIKLDDYLVGIYEDQPILTRISAIKRFTETGVIPTHILVYTDQPIKQFIDAVGNIQVEKYSALEKIFDYYNTTKLKGFTIKEYHLPNGTNAKVRELYSVITQGSLRAALIDPEMISFRYFVDTFNCGLEPFSKSYLSSLIQDRSKCFGLLNTPTIDEFRNSSNPRFTDTPTPSDPVPQINIQYIRDGGNLEENPDFLYTLPDETDGASYVAFFMPEIEIRDEDSEYVLLPPAAFVSNNFIRKYTNGNQYKAVAGTKRGVIVADGLVGTSYPFTKEERGFLEQKGINPIWSKANGDVEIFGNQTSYQKFRSILNNIHARDTLITFEIDVESILSNYIFDTNDDNLRTEVLSLLRNYYENKRDTYSALVTFELIFNRENNPDWVVSENASIVDTIIQLPNVTRKFINRITLRSGATPIVGGFVAV